MSWANLKIDPQVMAGIMPVAMFEPSVGAVDPEWITAHETAEAKGKLRSLLLDFSGSAIERSGETLTNLLDAIAAHAELTEDLQRALCYCYVCRWYSQQRWADEDRYQADSESACSEAERLAGVLARYWPMVLGYTSSAREVWAL